MENPRKPIADIAPLENWIGKIFDKLFPNQDCSQHFCS
ncbi:hypothetical protein NIES2104_28150 [Leptolyngbya sp. NIES-2104]|nr:hypothetical protein NIES2104_28150 [Leptolyngbya sp. NIES-2104]